MATIILFMGSCSGSKTEEKGFSVNRLGHNVDDSSANGIGKDSMQLHTWPGSVLLTGNPRFRLTTVYKVNRQKKDQTAYIGSNHSHGNYSDYANSWNNSWHYHFMPGLEAVCGYNMVNISHFDTLTQQHRTFFEQPVLIRTIYYPSYEPDTLNKMPVLRQYYLVSVYDEDTNKDGFINLKDLRRFYYFDQNANNRQILVPANYSVLSSEYDPGTDAMYVYAQLDENKNGQREDHEVRHIFRVDLTNPLHNGRMY